MEEKGIILIVDDNKNNQEICRICLEPENYRVYFAGNGDQGLRLTRQIRPDLILCDIMMPVMDGYQMIEKLKTDPDIKDIPVLVLTVITGSFDVVKAFQLGANDFLKKPFNVDEFIARVNSLIKHKKDQDAVKRFTENLREQQKFFEFELIKWTREAESFRHQLDVTFADVSDDAYAEKNIDLVLTATKQAKELISKIISFGRQGNYEQICV